VLESFVDPLPEGPIPSIATVEDPDASGLVERTGSIAKQRPDLCDTPGSYRTRLVEAVGNGPQIGGGGRYGWRGDGQWGGQSWPFAPGALDEFPDAARQR
jgi:hypothetical protein